MTVFVTGTHNVHLNGKNTTSLSIEILSFLPSSKPHVLYFLYFELGNYILFHRRSFEMINFKTINDPILWLPSGYSCTSNFTDRDAKYVNRLSPERTEDDLPLSG